MEDISKSACYEDEVIIENCELDIKIEDPLIIESNIPLLTCETCDFMTTSSVALEGHKQSHSECYYMNTKSDFVTSSVLQSHTYVKKCEKCDFSCELDDDMKLHEDVYHQTPCVVSLEEIEYEISEESSGNNSDNSNPELSHLQLDNNFEHSPTKNQSKEEFLTPKKSKVKLEFITPEEIPKRKRAKSSDSPKNNLVKNESVSPKVGQKRGKHAKTSVSPDTSSHKHGQCEKLELFDIEEMPLTRGLETPLHPKRTRSKRPVSEDRQPNRSQKPAARSPAKQSPRKRKAREVRDDVDNVGSEEDSDNEVGEVEDFVAPSLVRAYRSEFYADLDDEQPSIYDVPATAFYYETCIEQPSDFYKFEWRTLTDDAISPKMRREKFSSKCGPTAPNADPYSNFISIWDRKIMKHIVSETNAYAQEVAAIMAEKNTLGPNSRICCWKDVTVDEMYTLFAIFLAMGMVTKSQITDYWNTSTDIFMTPGFRAYMSLRRFQLLCQCLHFSRNGRMPPGLDPGQAKLYKIQPILTHLNDKFQKLYHLSQNIALDESLLQWSGWLNINQFIPNKAAKMGIKSYELCESQTGYLWRFEIHSHKTVQPPSTDPMLAITPAMVLRLIEGLEYKGHTLWMDNYYNSPALARKLKSLGTDCVGTLRTNRQFVPNTVKQLTKENMKTGLMTAVTSGDVDIVVWKDRNRVATISTYHGAGVTRVGDTKKPIVISDYNIMMGGVDKKDQLLSAFPMERKRSKVWYKKLFKHLLNVSVLNAHIISKKSGSSLIHREFRKKLVKDILRNHAHSPQPIEIPTIRQPEIYNAFEHNIGYNPLRGNGLARLRRQCTECGSLCTTNCTGCKKTMCAVGCFALAHKRRLQ